MGRGGGLEGEKRLSPSWRPALGRVLNFCLEAMIFSTSALLNLQVEAFLISEQQEAPQHHLNHSIFFNLSHLLASRCSASTTILNTTHQHLLSTPILIIHPQHPSSNPYDTQHSSSSGMMPPSTTVIKSSIFFLNSCLQCSSTDKLLLATDLKTRSPLLKSSRPLIWTQQPSLNTGP